MARQKTKIKDTLDDFLFRQIEADPDYRTWAESYTIPAYITDNLHPSKVLRGYQEVALKHFIWLYERDRAQAKHLLVNMATGTGKTLVMAACVLFLYEKGYRNFLFLVHQVQILEQAKKNFVEYNFEKYLFNPQGIRIHGQKVDVQVVDKLQDAGRSSINFLFFSTSLLYNRLREERENGLTAEDFAEHDIVIIADEAHRLNVDTRTKNKKIAEEAKNWETAVMSAVRSREENMLLEFTATVDLANENIHRKYQNKLVCRYGFLQFNKDGYSKDVKFLFNQETQIEDQKRLLIVNAVALSEYRRLLAERTMKVQINPIILIKSSKIKASEDDREFFDKVIGTLRSKDLNRLREVGQENADHEHELISDMFAWLHNQKISPEEFIGHIRTSFARDNTLIYNNQKKEKAELLPLLDSPRSTIRAIFSVNALNEGWDVLSLYDIIHFDISEGKKVSLQDIQLIGRGARLCPYELPKAYTGDNGNQTEMFKRDVEFSRYKRKFDKAPNDTGRALETLIYHFVKTGMFLENLQRDLLGEGIINEGVEKKTIRMKRGFLESDTYRKGFVLTNKVINRTKTSGEELDVTFNKVIKASSYNLRTRALSDYEENQAIASQRTKVIRIKSEFFPDPVIHKALVSAENGFFRFSNLCQHLRGLKSIDELVKMYLPLYEIKYSYEKGKDIGLLSPEQKLHLLVSVILPEVRKAIDLNLPKTIGSTEFRPRPLSQVFADEKSIYLMSFPVKDPQTGEITYASSDERAKEQTGHESSELRYDVQSAEWYAYDENYGTTEEKKFVKWLASQIDNLHERYPGAEVYVIRNELDYWLFSPADGRRFAPDYLMIINDHQNKEMYYQCVIEPKGGHLLEHDEWKEEALTDLQHSRVVLDSNDGDKRNCRDYLAKIKKLGYQEIKNIGLKFYNSDSRGEADFALDFEDKVLS